MSELPLLPSPKEYQARFKLLYELMQSKVRDILLVSSLYDACIIDEDGRLAEKIITEYRGLNLSQPPRLTWVGSAALALKAIKEKNFDLVITMLRLADMDAFALGEALKELDPDLPVILLSHSVPDPAQVQRALASRGIDRVFVWSGNTELLVALVKSVEDQKNVVHDTELAGVRVILLVEDSPIYLSSLLPVLYKEVVLQTQALMEEGLNEEHKLLMMRARPKILVAENYEEACDLFSRFEPYVLGVISDVRFPRDGRLNERAGIDFLTKVKGDRPDIPLLLTSSESTNAGRALDIPALFIDKNSSTLHEDVRAFLTRHLGFGDFVFRLPDGKAIGRASNLRDLEKILPKIPAESFYYHWSRNDFSRWLFARCEILLASKLRPATDKDFSGDVERMREFIVTNISARRKQRQRGVVASLEADGFDPDTDFFKIGTGSLGGKARGLVFLANLLRRYPEIHEKFRGISIVFPQTLVITTEGFDAFLEANDLRSLSNTEASDEAIARLFLAADFPEWIVSRLRAYLSEVTYPLAVRSSSILEDSQMRPFAGLYRTYMLSNNHENLEFRLRQLITAIKLVYASTYFKDARSFAKRTPHRTEEEKMGIIIQKLVGKRYGDYFYPAISGVAQSHNYYPFANMRTEDGIVHVALGLGKTVMEGGRVLRFCPRHPQILPQFSSIDDILKNSQRTFYCLNMAHPPMDLDISEESTLEKRWINDAASEEPVQLLTGTYVPEENRIKDGGFLKGPKVVTFSQVLKYKVLPLPEILAEMLEMGKEGMGCPVEIEFSVNLSADPECQPQFAPLQIRPMAGNEFRNRVEISEDDRTKAFCCSHHSLGNGLKDNVRDIVYVDPDTFDVAHTVDMVAEIDEMNARLLTEGRKYLLIGPGRWGSADRWLGIPVNWSNISGVEAIVETTGQELKVEPSQGSHFFHNISTLSIDYLMITDRGGDFVRWQWLKAKPVVERTKHVVHVRLAKPVLIKVDGQSRMGVMIGSE